MTGIQLYDNSVDFAISAWLHEKKGRTGSERTLGEYARTLADFRRTLQSSGTDLDGDVRSVALHLQAWATRGTSHRDVSGSTANTRCACVSSFYRYCLRQGMLGLTQNPAERVARHPVHRFQKATPLSLSFLSGALGRIRRENIQGLRDYALLAITFVTGRRLSELQRLCWEDVSIEDEGVTLTWTRTKGGKRMKDRLPKSVGQALLAYRTALMSLPSCRSLILRSSSTVTSTTPVWLSFSRNATLNQLSTKGLERVCLKHLGTSKFHSLRHTFAHAMENAGAKVSSIQSRLGHSSLAVTSEYLDVLRSEENEFAETLADSVGLGAEHLT